MLTTIRSNLIARLRGFHQEEDGSVTMETIAIGAVGVLLAAALFTTMSSAISSGSSSGSGGGGVGGIVGSLVSGLVSKIPSLLGL
jgi:hypothetical protein